MAKTTMYVTKSETLKAKTNVALINTLADVPEFLQETVIVRDGQIYIGECIEGKELCPIGSFIAWERDESCAGGFNTWCKSNGHETLVQIDGVWYEKPTVVLYEELDWSDLRVPEFGKDAPVDIEGGKIVLHASWGDQTAEAPEPYAFLGYPDGSFALLKLNSESARAYFVCTEQGKVIRPLVG